MGVGPGSIILFHNAAKHTPEALPAVIEYLLQNGYEIVSVSELLLTGDYEMDHTGRMCKAGTSSK
jgi:peptidoglycan/xylan/chitin deacetylase (PgdA/CDA1 family)